MENRIAKIVEILDRNKGEHIEKFDLRNSDYFVDYVVIATSLGERHNDALVDFLKSGLKPEESFNHVESSDGWVVADLGDILIHIMTEKHRNLYDLDSFLQEFEKKGRKNG
jgi:ribosome-associated protein